MYSSGTSFMYLKKTPIHASQNSSVLVAKNGLYIYNGVSLTTSQAILVVLSGSSLTLSNYSRFTVSRNEFVSSNVSGVGDSFWRLLWITKVVNLTGSSTLEVSNTNVNIVNPSSSSLFLGAAAVPPPPTFYGVWLSDAVQLGSSNDSSTPSAGAFQKSTLLISGNIINLPPGGSDSSVVLWLESTTRYIFENGALEFANNSVSNVASFILIPDAQCRYTHTHQLLSELLQRCSMSYIGKQRSISRITWCDCV